MGRVKRGYWRRRRGDVGEGEVEGGGYWRRRRGGSTEHLLDLSLSSTKYSHYIIFQINTVKDSVKYTLDEFSK